MKKKKQKSVKTTTRRRINKKYNDNKFFSWFLILLAILALLLTILWVGGDKADNNTTNKTISNSDASMILEAETTQLSKGENFVVKVYSDSTETDVNAVSSVVLFDNSFLELNEIISEASDYPIKAYEGSNNSKAEVVRGASDSISGKKFVADIVFKAINSGDTIIEFEEESTYLVSSENNKDILGNESFNNLTIKVN